ncbi:hypothetical protein [Gracilibacillus salinarum]|uniref:Uncharacterized protein n=1 Tax=Gracilibacillus salinarum TaxID=2932255 RepID=A0ABY4GTB2_9BACI|nr:hypothetical protein [Gracilibacillus salinarum]UOQ87215.1 hypothetical protein MUN87_10160 [Gracilibacillus salinarum]
MRYRGKKQVMRTLLLMILLYFLLIKDNVTVYIVGIIIFFTMEIALILLNIFQKKEDGTTLMSMIIY